MSLMVIGTCLMCKQIITIGLLVNDVARGCKQCTIVMPFAVEILPRVTCRNIDVRLDYVEVLLVVGIEVEQRVGAVLVYVVVGTGAILVVGTHIAGELPSVMVCSSVLLMS